MCAWGALLNVSCMGQENGPWAPENGWIVRPEVPRRGVQGTELCLVHNRKAAPGYPASIDPRREALHSVPSPRPSTRVEPG